METPIKILIIDDNEEIVNVLYSFFSNRRYNVSTAINGLDGLKLIEADNISFDLIITDLIMPNISGTAVITIVKKKYPTIPIIAITGWGEHSEALAAEAQADVILEKPFDLPELEKTIKKLLVKKSDSHKHRGHKKS